MLRQRGRLQPKASAREGIDVLIAEDNVDLQRLYQKSISSWALPISIRTVANGIDGLLNIGLRPPDILIVDLLMPGVDGFEMIHRIRMNAELDDMDIIVVTGMDRDEIQKRGGLPDTVTVYQKPIPFTVYQKPIPFTDLRGYLQAKLAQHRRTLQGNSNR
jgi:CheY-like chemotaxis protein